MTQLEATAKAVVLWQKWITHSTTGLDLELVRASIKRELAFYHSGKSTISKGLASEMHGELILLGKLRKVLTAS